MTGQTTITAPTRAGLSARLEADILSGRVAEGEKLPSERELAGRYGVSRPVVREAMRTLIERNLVEAVPGRGTYVRAARSTDAAPGMDTLLRRRQPTPRDLVEARTMLECTAAELAARRADVADLAAMADALGRLDAAADVIERARYDLAFHLAIARAAHNPVIETMFGAISGLTIELMLRSLADPVVAPTSLPYHRTIYDGIRTNDAVGARAAMAAHLAVAARTYGADLDRSLESVARRELARLLEPGVTLEDLLATVPDGRDDGRR
jgi:GntR family transcriptional regulator, transcriptional repressor for pyruvate dehydrogenase complex